MHINTVADTVRQYCGQKRCLRSRLTQRQLPTKSPASDRAQLCARQDRLCHAQSSCCLSRVGLHSLLELGASQKCPSSSFFWRTPVLWARAQIQVCQVYGIPLCSIMFNWVALRA